MGREHADGGEGRSESEERGGRSERLERYETFLAVLPAPVFVTDARGYLTFANRAFTRQFGHEVSAGGSLHISDVVVDDDVDALLSVLREMVAEADSAGRPRAVEVEGVTADGRTLTLGGSVALLPHDGEFAGAAAVLRDVSARRRRQQVFTVMDRALRHNLRTNVSVITGYADVLEEALGPDHRTDVERIRDAAEWIQKLGTSFRTLQMAIEESFVTDETVGVERVVESAAASARRADPDAEVTVHLSARGELAAGPPVEHAVENIVENAVVHNDTAEPTVDVWVAHAPRDGWIDVHVEDDGPGIPAFEREIVLGDADVDQLQHGSGIGLWITRWVVEVFDGALEIEDNDPRGTVVTLRFPLAGGGDPSG